MKTLLPLLLILLSAFHLQAQNCGNTSVGYPPIFDLGTGYWRGSQGGLYPGGSDFRPASHNQAGLSIAQNILPLDSSGNVDMVNGVIIWLSIGMSNTTMETQMFLPMADTFSQKNPKLLLVDGAQGGQDINEIINPQANFWNVINQRLANVGASRNQVQVVWFKEAEGQPSDTAFATYPDSLKLKFKDAMRIIKNKFPNTKLSYLSSRIYAGYASTQLNPEPFAYYSGWSVKRLIEDQINGDTTLTYTGMNPRVPWLAWGPYLWADGTSPRSDGLTWICPDDYNNDGTHPSNAGRQKVANMLFNFFSTDSTTVPWFLDQTATGIHGIGPDEPVKIFPNPAGGIIQISSGEDIDQISIYNLVGEKLSTHAASGKETSMDVSQFPRGAYFIKLTTKNNVTVRKLILR